jgi:hypothetical protein
VNNATLYISAGGTEVIDDCTNIPASNCENADLFHSTLGDAQTQQTNTPPVVRVTPKTGSHGRQMRV